MGSVVSIYNEMNNFYKSGNYQKVLDLYNKNLFEYSFDCNVFYMAISSCIFLNKFNKAAAIYNYAFKNGKIDSAILASGISIFSKLNNIEEAQNAYKIGIENKVKSKSFFVESIKFFYDNCYNNDEILNVYNRAIELHIFDQDIFIIAMKHCIKKDKYEKFVSIYNKAIAVNKANSDTYELAMKGFIRAKHNKEALNVYDKATSLNEVNENITLLSEIAKKNIINEANINRYNAAVNNGRLNSKTLRRAVKSYIESKEFEELPKVYKKSLELKVYDSHLFEHMIGLNNFQQRYDEALKVYNKAVSSNKTTPEIFERAIEALYKKSKDSFCYVEDFLQIYEKALFEKKTTPKIFEVVILICRENAMYNLAKHIYYESVGLNQNNYNIDRIYKKSKIEKSIYKKSSHFRGFSL